ncbi:hypothetical protein MalM25_14800 [Planctomycetes bacterium MalM25]|nr:hypothetical protein MalM25_14800 [Planctomycetes bacterium MalM25]
MMFSKVSLGRLSAAALLLFGAGQAAAIEFNEIARLNVDFAFAANIGEQEPPDPDNNPQYIGTNPLGLAWNGSKMYLAGFDNFGSSLLPIGLIEVLNPASISGAADLGASDFSPAFGQIFQPIGRGYSGLAIEGGRLAAAYDNGSATANGIQVFDTADNSLLWDLSDSSATARGGSGVAFDPGFPGGDAAQGAGVAWTTFGSGRRALNNTETGATVWQLDDLIPETLGMQWLTDAAGVGNFARDLAFDPDTGDVYTRRSNDVDAADRTGDNATDNRRTIVDNASNGNFKIGGKIEFLADTDDGDLLIYNDSSASSLGQAFADVVKVIDTDGVAQSPTFTLLGGEVLGDLGTGNGVYDFDYDAASNTLAVLDFANRNVHVFSLGAVGGDLTGDYNGDGVVDAIDYTVWRDTLGGTAVPSGSGADGNDNGVIDNGDYDVWSDNYGATLAAAVAVPEPATALLVVLGVGACLSRRV